MKIIDILHQCEKTGRHCLSFEYYPPKDRTKWAEFYEKISRMSRLCPDFIDVTWGTGDPTSTATLEIAQNIQELTHIETMMHLTCTHRSRRALMDIVNHVRTCTTMRNIMALRGNRPPDAPWQPHPEGFQNAAELIAGIRSEFGDTFSIAAAGYPEGHREDGLPPDRSFIGSEAYYRQIDHLRMKVDAGADFVITQLCYDLDQMCRYRDDCAAHGIHCPIIPGILPIHSRSTWEKIATFSASISDDLKAQFDAIPADDPEALERFASELLRDQLDYLHSHGFYAVHLYTLNHERLISNALNPSR